MKNSFRVKMLTLSTMLYSFGTAVSFITNLITSNNDFLYLTIVFNTLMLLSMFTIMLYLESGDNNPTLLPNLFGFILASPILIIILTFKKIIDFVKDEGGDEDE